MNAVQFRMLTNDAGQTGRERGLEFLTVARDQGNEQAEVAMSMGARTAAIVIGYLVNEFGLSVAMPAVLSKLRPMEQDDLETTQKFHGVIEAVDPAFVEVSRTVSGTNPDNLLDQLSIAKLAAISKFFANTRFGEAHVCQNMECETVFARAAANGTLGTCICGSPMIDEPILRTYENTRGDQE